MSKCDRCVYEHVRVCMSVREVCVSLYDKNWAGGKSKSFAKRRP